MLLTKHCNFCNKDKPITDFYKKTSTPDGYNYLCKKCDARKRSELRFRDINKTLIKERISSKQYRDKKEFYLCWELSECDSFNDISKEID
jgi:hypothetical protein